MAVVQDLEAHRVDQLRDALLHLPSPERGRDLSQHLVEAVEDGGVLADQHERQLALAAQDAAELVQRAHDVVGREQFQQVAAEDRVERIAAERHVPGIDRLAVRLGGGKSPARDALRARRHVGREVDPDGRSAARWRAPGGGTSRPTRSRPPAPSCRRAVRRSPGRSGGRANETTWWRGDRLPRGGRTRAGSVRDKVAGKPFTGHALTDSSSLFKMAPFS